VNRWSNTTASSAIALALLTVIGVQDGAALPRVIVIDEDSIDNSSPAILELAQMGVCGGGNPAICVNDQLANPGVRDPLNIPPGTIIGSGVPGGTSAMLFTGQIGDEAWFELRSIPQSWVTAGPTPDGATNYQFAMADGFGRNGEFLLDKIPDVTPLHADGLRALIGQTLCAVVYDSNVSINYQPLEGNLQGANYGVLALEVLAVGPDPNGSVLPDITIRVKDPSTCGIGTVHARTRTWGMLKMLYR
jgi:hypothetical protein